MDIGLPQYIDKGRSVGRQSELSRVGAAMQAVARGEKRSIWAMASSSMRTVGTAEMLSGIAEGRDSVDRGRRALGQSQV